MYIDNYFETYRELLDRLETDQLLSPFGISTEADKSEDVKKINVLMEYKDEIKEKLTTLPGNSPLVTKMPIELNKIAERTDQIIRKSIEDRKDKSPLIIQLWQISCFWAEVNTFLMPSTYNPDKNDAKNSDQLILDDRQKHILEDYFNMCDSIFNTSFPEFIECIRFADFGCVIKIKSKAMYLTYKLSDIFGDEWYGKMCQNMGWQKSKCSGSNVNKENLWRKKIDAFAKRITT